MKWKGPEHWVGDRWGMNLRKLKSSTPKNPGRAKPESSSPPLRATSIAWRLTLIRHRIKIVFHQDACLNVNNASRSITTAKFMHRLMQEIGSLT